MEKGSEISRLLSSHGRSRFTVSVLRWLPGTKYRQVPNRHSRGRTATESYLGKVRYP
jgi:hypothetical protein